MKSGPHLNMCHCMQVFFGSLRESEIERVNDRISQAVMETCLAMTIFRDEFNVEFVAMFVTLTFIKVFHWLVQDRVDYIETTPTVSRLHHSRIISFIFLLGVQSAPCSTPDRHQLAHHSNHRRLITLVIAVCRCHVPQVHCEQDPGAQCLCAPALCL